MLTFVSYYRCICGAITLVTDDGRNFSCEESNFDRFFSGIDLNDLKQEADTFFCNHCVNHYGLDLCACGSGEAPENCGNGFDCCGHPMQSLEGGYTHVRAGDAIGLTDGAIFEEELANDEDDMDNASDFQAQFIQAIEAEQRAKAFIAGIVQHIIDAIHAAPVPGVKQICESPSCFTIKYSDISRNNLSAEFYDADTQARLVERALQAPAKANSASGIAEKIRELLDKKSVVIDKTTYALNDTTLGVLAGAYAKMGCDT